MDDSVHKVTSLNLARLFAVDETLMINGGGWKEGGVAPAERLLIAQLLRYFQPKRLLEVGTYRGTTTRLMLDSLNPGSHIYTIDLPLDRQFEQNAAATDQPLIEDPKVGVDYLSHPLAGTVTQILGNSLNAATWQQVPDSIDFAFIDASHSYEAVRNDTQQVFDKIAPEAVVIWHDYTLVENAERGVGKFIRELMLTRRDIFVCEGTEMALRIPPAALQRAESQVARWFAPGEYQRRYPAGILSWLTRPVA
jgi:predicted O-methyltransferase YrrM